MSVKPWVTSLTTNVLLDRLTVIEWVRRWGELNTDGILDPNTQYFALPGIQGVIGYRVAMRHAVVFGDPVCAPSDQVELVEQFEQFCQAQRLRSVYIMASRRFMELAIAKFPWAALEFGTKFVLDPNRCTSSPSALLRKKLRQSARHGVVVREYQGKVPEIERTIEQLALDWIKARRGIQIYLATPNIFDNRLGKRWFYAIHQEQVVGFLVVNQMQACNGWLLNNVMVGAKSPSGLSEILIMSAMAQLAQEKCQRVLVGPAPAKQLGTIIGLHKMTGDVIQWTYRMMTKIFHLEGHEIFWEKFKPESEPAYLVFPKITIRGVMAVFRALNISLKIK
jgi:lysylphosphatidylglycerol synthetase-like protein (DUF2156 family)